MQTAQGSPHKAALRALVEQSKTERYDSRRNAARIKQAASYLFAQFNLSSESRDLLFTFYGLSEGNNEFDCPYALLYRHLFKADGSEVDENGDLTDTARQRVRRRIEHLTNEQREIDITFADIHPGYKDDQGRHPTRISLHLLDHIDDILERCAADPTRGKRPRAAIERAARKVALELEAEVRTRAPGTRAEIQAPITNPFRAIDQGWKRTAGNFNATVEQMRKQGYEDWAIWQDAMKHVPPEFINFIRNGQLTLDYKSTDTVQTELKEHGGGGTDPNSLAIPHENYIDVSQEQPELASADEVEGITFDTFELSEMSSNQEFEKLTTPILHSPEGREWVTEVEQIASPLEEFGPAPIDHLIAMVDTFASVGHCSFALTLIDDLTPGLTREQRKQDYQDFKNGDLLKEAMQNVLERCERAKLSVIVRPRLAGADRRLIQLDDLDCRMVGQLQDLALLVIETSPDNYQVWIASDNCSGDVERQLKKGVGADSSASGATRIAGSINFKPKYEPDFPRVRMVQARPGRTVEVAKLEQRGLLDPKQIETVRARHAPISAGGSLVWPSYQRSLADAPSASSHEGPDRSWADFNFCQISALRGWPVEEIAQRLMVESEKAQQEGFSYARFTAKRAAGVISKAKH